MTTASQSASQNIALFGGTFDPIHLGHILPAQATAKWLGVEQLQLIPAHIPPHKAGTHASAKQRAEMVSLVCDTQTMFTLDNRELLRESHSYTVDTLREIKTDYPNATLYFIIGMDSLLAFTTWHAWQDILTLCNLVVNIRPGYPHAALTETLSAELTPHLVDNIQQLQRQQSGQIILHNSTAYDISSTKIRAKIKAGQNYRQYLPEPVYQYIEQHQLYR
ncbi:MAG: nicotinate-nucleotide adenylyltransferase [Cognaticolwellia sp.]